MSNCCDPLRDAFHTPMIKITYTPHILPTSTLEVVQHVIHSYSLQVERTWASKKMDTWRSKTLKKRKKRNLDTWRSNVFQKKVSPCPKENKREIAHERSSYIIHKFHTLAHLDQGLWLVSPKDPVFDSATQEEQVCLQLFPTLSST